MRFFLPYKVTEIKTSQSFLAKSSLITEQEHTGSPKKRAASQVLRITELALSRRLLEKYTLTMLESEPLGSQSLRSLRRQEKGPEDLKACILILSLPHTNCVSWHVTSLFCFSVSSPVKIKVRPGYENSVDVV